MKVSLIKDAICIVVPFIILTITEIGFALSHNKEDKTSGPSVKNSQGGDIWKKHETKSSDSPTLDSIATHRQGLTISKGQTDYTENQMHFTFTKILDAAVVIAVQELETSRISGETIQSLSSNVSGETVKSSPSNISGQTIKTTHNNMPGLTVKSSPSNISGETFKRSPSSISGEGTLKSSPNGIPLPLGDSAEKAGQTVKSSPSNISNRTIKSSPNIISGETIIPSPSNTPTPFGDSSEKASRTVESSPISISGETIIPSPSNTPPPFGDSPEKARQAVKSSPRNTSPPFGDSSDKASQAVKSSPRNTSPPFGDSPDKASQTVESSLPSSKTSPLLGGESPTTTTTPGVDLPRSTSLRCMTNLVTSRTALLAKARWAQEMADSTGHVGSGQLGREVDMLGAVGQCLGVRLPPALLPVTPVFSTQYCLVTLSVSMVSLPEALKPDQPSGFSVGLCLPDTCSKEDAKSLVTMVLQSQKQAQDVSVHDSFCTKEESSSSTFTPAAAALLALLALWLALVLVASLLDCYFCARGVQPHPQPASPHDGGVGGQHRLGPVGLTSQAGHTGRVGPTSQSGQPAERTRQIIGPTGGGGRRHDGQIRPSPRQPQQQKRPAQPRPLVKSLLSRSSSSRPQRQYGTSKNPQIDTNIDGDIVTTVTFEASQQPPAAGAAIIPHHHQVTTTTTTTNLPLGRRERQIRGILRGGGGGGRDLDASLRTSTETGARLETRRLRGLVRCLSLRANARRLLDTSVTHSELGCLHGIRALSLAWLVLVNTLMYQLLFTRNAFRLLKEWRHYGFRYPLCANGYLGLDSLFAISGLLLGYAHSKKLEKASGTLSWLRLVLQRYWRVVPALVVVGLSYLALFPHLASGPLAISGVAPDQDACLRWGWLSLFLLHNLAPSTCLSWTWFLAVDFQLFLLAPFLLWLLHRRPRLAYFVVFVVVLVSCIVSGAITQNNELSVALFPLPDVSSDHLTTDNNTISHNANAFASMYLYMPWAHAGAFYPPLLVGYLLYRSNRRASFSTRTVAAGWAVTAAVFATVLFGVKDELLQSGSLSQETLSLYNSVSRVAWGLGVSWVVVACSTERGGPVTWLLAWRGWKPCSRLALGLYLVHPVVQQATAASLHQLMYATAALALYQYGAVLLCSLTLAALVSLTVQMPLEALPDWVASSCSDGTRT